MSTRKRIILYGNSVVLGSLGASLENGGRFTVVRLSPPWPHAAALRAMAPDAILFDSDLNEPEALFSLLGDRPQLLLLGVSPDNNVVQLWSGRRYHELSTPDLAALIETGSSGRGDLGVLRPGPRSTVRTTARRAGWMRRARWPWSQAVLEPRGKGGSRL